MASAEVNRIISLMFAAGRVMHEQTGHRPDPVSLLKLQTLRYVQEAGRPLMKDVARYLCITPPSATSLIASLVRSRMLRRQIDQRDRRIIRLTVTTLGRRYLQQGLRQSTLRMSRQLAKLNTKERRQLITILQKLSMRHPIT